MSALGRILGILGLVWIAVALFGGAFNLPGLNIFPGIIMLFIARGLRRQARRSKGTERGERVDQEEEPEEAPRVLNTERPPRPNPRPAPKPPPVTSSPSESVRNPEPSPKSEQEKTETLESILLAGQEAADPDDEITSSESVDNFESGRSLTSEELIAQARRRWDRKN